MATNTGGQLLIGKEINTENGEGGSWDVKSVGNEKSNTQASVAACRPASQALPSKENTPKFLTRTTRCLLSQHHDFKLLFTVSRMAQGPPHLAAVPEWSRIFYCTTCLTCGHISRSFKFKGRPKQATRRICHRPHLFLPTKRWVSAGKPGFC